MIKYLGSKRVLLPRILDLVQGLPEIRTALDLFSGTARVGQALKAGGVQVTSNDHTAFAATLARCYVQADAMRWSGKAERLLKELDQIPARPGWFTHTYCETARYFMPHNGARIDAIRDEIARLGLEPELEAIALVSLMEAADRVDSTCGIQMAYLKQWAARAHRTLELRVPALLPGQGRALQADASEAVLVPSEAPDGAYDLLYLDPPYNQHKYLGNYHIWETLVRWDKPETYGVANKRIDCKAYKSPYNSAKTIGPALAEVIARANARFLLVSFSNEGFLSRGALEDMLSARGPVQVVEQEHRRYIGAQIGIYSPQGEKVGQASHLHNTELFYLVEVQRS